ncbi:MAG: YlxR family protein [Actinobacteria bacterium]|nr:YlxR family protein [Actinomycetota bacterium]
MAMTPTRMCVSCRSREPQNLLIRIVLADNHAVVDPSGTLPGRGAWLHRDAQCFSTAIQRKTIARALRVPVSLDVSAVADFASSTLT